MFYFLNQLSRQILVSFITVMATTLVVFSQGNKPLPSVEKIYAHTDRTVYTLGENLWYKTYSVYAYNHLLYNQSNILYVELISPDAKIISQNVTKMENGLGFGDFNLADSLGFKAGTYQLRAYTNYSRNFGTDFIFKKNIEILDVFDKSDIKKEQDLKKQVVKNNVATNETNAHKIQFFPEGGALIMDVETTIAFKAEDTNGNPIHVKGKVYDAEGILITLFMTTHDGMGKFNFKPLKDKQYYAQILNSHDVLIKEPLPKSLEMGYVLGYKKMNDNDILTVKTNQETLSKNLNSVLTLLGNTRGVSYFETSQNLTKTTLFFQLAKNDFPEGISQVTLYDANARPQSERLIYIEKENHLDITLHSDKNTYKPNEKATIQIISKTKNNKVVPASFSLSCTDTNGANDEKDYGSTIFSYFLMESDIRGQVRNPSYYFDTKNPKRLTHLDLLLLTQGWRDFLWKTIPQPQADKYYEVENNFLIAGHVKAALSTKPVADINVSLALINDQGLNYSQTITDTLGRFKFENLEIYGETNLVLNSKNEKGKNRGEIIVYPTKKPPLDVDLFTNKTQTSSIANTIKENIYKKYILNGIAPENMLAEVEIIAKKKESTPSLYGTPDSSYEIGSDTPNFSDIFQLIRFIVPGVIVEPESIRFARYPNSAHIILDGVPIFDVSEISFIQPSNVGRIEVLKGASAGIFGADGANGVLIIYTKEPTANNFSAPKPYHVNQKIEGFYNARVFYLPNKEETPFEENASLSVRNTLYWNPDIFPNREGVTSVTYPNTSVQTTVKVSLEGITDKGIPVVVKTYYTIGQ